MVTDKAEEQTALHFACIILFLYLRIRACFLSRRSAASPSVPPVDAQQSLRPATVTEVTAKSLIFVLTQRHLNVFLLLNLQYWHANEPRENSLEGMCRLCYDQMAMGDIHCHSFAFLYSHHCSEFLTVSPGEKKKERERERKCTALCQLTTLQTGADHAWQTHLIKQGGRKLENKRPVWLHGSHVTINSVLKDSSPNEPC